MENSIQKNIEDSIDLSPSETWKFMQFLIRESSTAFFYGMEKKQ